MHLFQQHPFPQQQFLFDLYAGLGHCPTDPTSDGPLMLKALSRHSVDTMFPLQPKVFVLICNDLVFLMNNCCKNLCL